MVGAVLRFWNYYEIPFSHDEFSALFRTDFSSFSELIDLGVRPDGHPAGVQVFLYYWTGLFGSSEWIVKLPFTLMGLTSVYLVYLVGRQWYTASVGLIAAAFLSCLQFSIVYSGTARPYISGMFFVLAMVWFWSKLIHNQGSLNRNTVLYILYSTLCAYNHHFSLLFAAIVGVSGLFFVSGKLLKRYLLSGVVIFILYIPHLGIFFDQLSLGGIGGWLAKPQPDFLINYLSYIFHYSEVFYILTALLVLVGGLFYRDRSFDFKKLFLFGMWFLLPIGIGYYYSLEVSSVLQYSVLIFSFPFLFFVLYGHVQELKPSQNLVVVLLILGVGAYSLSIERQHFRLFYNSHYEHIVSDIDEVDVAEDQTLFLIDSHKEITDYYRQENEVIDTLMFLQDFTDELSFRSFLESNVEKYNQVYLGAWSSTNANFVPMIMEYFPTIRWQNSYVGGSTILLTKELPDKASSGSSLTFEDDASDGWSSYEVERDTSNENGYYRLDNDVEWSMAYVDTLYHLVDSRYDFIDISVDAKSDSSVQGLSLVVVIEENGITRHWNNVVFSRFMELGDTSWSKVHHSVQLSDVVFGKDAVIKTFVWNSQKEEVSLDNYAVHVRQGNSVVYGLRDDF